MKRAARVTHDPGVMTGGDIVGAQGLGAPPQAVELDVAIAHQARIRRASMQVLSDEWRDYASREILAQIDHVKGKIHSLGHSPRVLEILVRATARARCAARRRV